MPPPRRDLSLCVTSAAAVASHRGESVTEVEANWAGAVVEPPGGTELAGQNQPQYGGLEGAKARDECTVDESNQLFVHLEAYCVLA